jgi:hypothetical protein
MLVPDEAEFAGFVRKKLVRSLEKIAGQALEGADLGRFYSYF